MVVVVVTRVESSEARLLEIELGFVDQWGARIASRTFASGQCQDTATSGTVLRDDRTVCTVRPCFHPVLIVLRSLRVFHLSAPSYHGGVGYVEFGNCSFVPSGGGNR